MKQMTPDHSPLAQIASRGGLRAASRGQRLSPRDEADLKLVLHNKYEYIDSDLFDLPEKQAMARIFDDAPDIEKPDTSWYHPVMDAKDAMARQSRNSGSVLLTAKQEQALFLQYNYCRFRVCLIRDELLDRPDIDIDLARELLRWYRKADSLRDQIAQTNLALVLAMAKRTRMSEVDFGDLVSDVPAPEGPYRVRIGTRTFDGPARAFADVPLGAGVSYVGSLGTVEVAVRDGCAAEAFGVEVGTPVEVLATA